MSGANMLPVYDPQEKTLKAIPANQAKSFIDMGLKVGPEAEAEQISQSTAGQVGAGLSALGNAGSFGLLNLGLGITGNKEALHNERFFQDKNPGTTLAATGIGTGAAILSGGYELGGLGSGVAEAASGKGLAAILARGANFVAKGAPAAALQGVSDTVAEDAILKHPMTAEQLAASAATDIFINAAFNAGVHGLAKVPKYLRSATGGTLNKLEEYGVLKRKMVLDEKLAAEMANAPTAAMPSSYTRIETNKFVSPEVQEAVDAANALKLSNLEAGLTDAQAKAAASKAAIPVKKAGDNRSVMEQLIEAGESDPHLAGPKIQIPDAIDGPLPNENPLPNLAHSADFPGIADAGPINTPADLAAHDAAHVSMVANAHEPVVNLPPAPEAYVPGEAPTFEDPLPQVREPWAKHAERQKAAKLRDAAEKKAPVKPDDVDWKLDWNGHTPEEKSEAISFMMRERVADTGNEQTIQAFHRLSEAEAEIRGIKAAEKTKEGFPNAPEKLDALYREKEKLRSHLFEHVPREIDQERGIFKPGYSDLHNEYRLAKGKAPFEKPIFSDFNQKKYDAAVVEHRKATEAADAAESKLRYHDERAAEIEARDDAIAERKRTQKEFELSEKQRKEKADLAQAEHNKLVKIETKRVAKERNAIDAAQKKAINSAAKEAAAKVKAEGKTARDTMDKLHKDAQKAVDDFLKDEREKARLLAKSEREAASAKAKATRKAEQEAAKIAREESAETREIERKTKAANRHAETVANQERRVAQEKARQAGIPRHGADNPVGSKSEKYTVDIKDEMGTRRETHFKSEKNGVTTHRVNVKTTVPKPTRPMKFGGYENIKTGNIGSAAYVATAMGHPHLAAGAAIGAAAAKAAIHVAGYRDALGKMTRRFGDPLFKGVGRSIEFGGRMAQHSGRGTAVPASYDLKDYQAVADSVNFAATSPEAVQQAVQQRFPNLGELDPQLPMKLTAILVKAAQALDAKVAKRPFNPTLQDTNFTPTRAQQVSWLRAVNLVSNPQDALRDGDFNAVQMLREVFPAYMEHAQTTIMSKMHESKTKMSGRQARQISGFLGKPVRPVDEAAALQRLQQTAGPPPMKPPQGNGGGGGKSAKITNQAVTRDATDGQKAALGD